MPTYKFKYFNSRGFGEVCRLMFALNETEFEDIRFTHETWPAEKPNTRLGVMPLLEVDGKQYTQSSAIARYLAREFGYYGKDNIEALEVDQVLGIMQDIINVIMIKMFLEKDEERRKILVQEAKEEHLPKYMAMLEQIVKDNGKGWLVGDKISLADIYVFDFTAKMKNMVNFADYPEVKKVVDRVGALPKIKAWVEKRPVTDN